MASYKRLHLIIQDPARAVALLQGPRALQVILAGKAHPRDEDAKRIVQLVFSLKAERGVGGHVAFLEDYDLAMAPYLLSGCDVWVNLPRPPLEASGTSGMKAALNGGLNLAVLDGWWCEGFRGDNGWAIRSDEGGDTRNQDARDAQAFYDLLEREVVPLRSDKVREVKLPRVTIIKLKETGAPHFQVLDGNIGYVDLGRLEATEVDAMFEALAKTRAIVFDDRSYPLGTAWSIAPRLGEHRHRIGARFQIPCIDGADESDAW